MTEETEPPFAIWQGFRHSWTYNHRLNRIGDWLNITSRDGDTVNLDVGHSGASGSGRDEASYRSFWTVTRAGGTFYKEFKRTVTIKTTEQDSQAFVREIRVEGLNEDYDVFAPMLAGFDLCSEKDADKLISFHLATSVAERDPETGDVVFTVIGALNVDCDSPECDNHASTGGMIASIAAGAAAGAVFGGAVGAVFGGVFGVLFAKLNITTDYTLEFRAALVAGRSDTLNVSRRSVRNSYDWDKDNVITRKNEGTRSVTLTGDADPRWQICVPAITQISLEVTREKGFLKPDTAMHLLEWDMSVQAVDSDRVSCTANLELFFRNWRDRESQFLDEQIEFPIFDEAVEDLFSHRDAGSAIAEMGLSLLQFAEAETVQTQSWADSHIWEAGGASAKSAKAENEVSRSHTIAAPVMPEPEPETGPVADETPLRLAADHIL